MAESGSKLLGVEGLRVSRADKEILNGVDLTVCRGEIHAVMGPNGSGKSTLANTLMGSPECEVLSGKVLFKGEDVTEEDPDVRARNGMFLAFQYPVSITGVAMHGFLRAAINSRRDKDDGIGVRDFRKLMLSKMKLVGMDPSFSSRYLNEGFSGGEKKRSEVLQMAVLEPELAILDETDSGLDIDALRTVASGVNALMNPEMGILLITHYERILSYIEPDYVHVFVEGRIVRSGGKELAMELEERGYDEYLAPVAGGI